MVGSAAAAAAAGAGELNIAIDNRASAVDQSTNQNIWSGGGDVNQAFGQEAQVNLGDWGAAAGDDANIDNSTTDITVGDVSIGNTWIDTAISDSFNDYSTSNEWDLDVEVEDSFNDYSDHTDVSIEDSFTSEIDAEFENHQEWESTVNEFNGNDIAGDDIIDL